MTDNLWDIPIEGHIAPVSDDARCHDVLVCMLTVSLGDVVMIRAGAFRPILPNKLEDGDTVAVSTAAFAIGERAKFREGPPLLYVHRHG